LGEGFSNLFLRAAILLFYLEYYRILFICLPNTLYPRTNSGRIYLGIYTGIVRDYSLYSRLLSRIYTQYFGMEVLLDIRQLELEIIYRLIPNLGTF
jgi:hypothetical protein